MKSTEPQIDQSVSAETTFTKRCLTACRKLIERLDHAKTAIVDEFSDSLRGNERLLELAIKEADALAWQTDFPELLFPTLAMEKAQALATWHEHQQWLRNRPAFAVAA